MSLLRTCSQSFNFKTAAIELLSIATKNKEDDRFHEHLEVKMVLVHLHDKEHLGKKRIGIG